MAKCRSADGRGKRAAVAAGAHPSPSATSRRSCVPGGARTAADAHEVSPCAWGARGRLCPACAWENAPAAEEGRGGARGARNRSQGCQNRVSRGGGQGEHAMAARGARIVSAAICFSTFPTNCPSHAARRRDGGATVVWHGRGGALRGLLEIRPGPRHEERQRQHRVGRRPPPQLRPSAHCHSRAPVREEPLQCIVGRDQDRLVNARPTALAAVAVAPPRGRR